MYCGLCLAKERRCSRAAGAWNETAVVLETNLDDMNPQLLGYFVDRAFEAGALDVFFTPVQMKKNRPGQLVTVLCSLGEVRRSDGLDLPRNDNPGRAALKRPATHSVQRKHCR